MCCLKSAFPSFAISDGVVTRPWSRPRAAALRISSRFAVSRKNFIIASLDFLLGIKYKRKLVGITVERRNSGRCMLKKRGPLVRALASFGRLARGVARPAVLRLGV